MALPANVWRSIFEPSLPVAEIVLRGSVIYLALFLILRFLARRQAGHFGPADLLVVVLIADAAQNGFGKEYTSVTEAILLVMTIVAWEYAIDWLGWRIPSLRPILKAPPLVLVEDGRLLEAHLRSEMISADDLAGQLRLHGVEDVKDVKRATLEGDGQLSVLKKRQDEDR